METVKLARMAMATRFELVLSGDDPARLRAFGEEALREIDRLDKQLSFYRPASEISRLNRTAHQRPVEVEGRLFELLLQAKQCWERTEGLFDLTVGPLMDTWGLTGSNGRLPNPEDVDDARARVGMHHVILDPNDRTVRFDKEGVQIDTGGIGKGFAADEVIGMLRDKGVTSALVHGGTSTIATIGDDPDGNPWRIAIGAPEVVTRRRDQGSSGHVGGAPSVTRNGRPHDPDSQPILGVVELRDQSLSVSDVGGKRFEIEGETYGHVIDPRAGAPTSCRQLSAVVGPSAAEADAMSTALLIADDDERSRLQTRYPNLKMLTTDVYGAVDYSDFGMTERAAEKPDLVTSS
ncbi:MAG: FAD:protein FMN transferase [Rhodothermia bacterium]|nr:FAD:protein FMN transferase [Rhodothermia bacterium]